MRATLIAVMHRLAWFLAFVVACSSGAPPPRNLPPATPSTTLGPSDLFEVNVVGDVADDVREEYQSKRVRKQLTGFHILCFLIIRTLCSWREEVVLTSLPPGL